MGDPISVTRIHHAALKGVHSGDQIYTTMQWEVIEPSGARVHGNNSAFTQDFHCARHCRRAGFDAEFRDDVLDVLAYGARLCPQNDRDFAIAFALD